MAIAPVNKFLSLAVPVAPGEQKLYEVPTGTTAILLYAQVSNVGIGQGILKQIGRMKIIKNKKFRTCVGIYGASWWNVGRNLVLIHQR